MPNQMIALQARAPQTDVLGSTIQRNAQMMNMMSQQRSAERQAAQAAQQMEIARAQEARAAAGEERAAAKFAIDQDALLYAKYRNMAPAVIESNNPEVYANWLAQLNAELPDRAKMIADAMPPERFNKDAFTLMMATMDQRFEARYGKAITKELIAPGPTPDSPATVLGVNISGIPGATYAAPVPDISRPRSGATPPVAGAAPTGGLRPTRGVNTTPADLRAQMTPATPAAVTPERLDAAARAVARGASITDPMLRDLSESDFLEVQKRASRLMQNSPEFQTMSAGGAAQPDLAGIVQTMMDTGVVSQSNLEAMRAAAGPGKDAQLAEILRSNNIRIMPDEQPAGGMRSAVYRPEEGAAGMTQVQYNPNDYEPVRVKSPMQSPLPGSSQVPLPRVREEAGAETGGSERAKRLEKLRGDIPTAKNATQSLIADVDDRIAAIDRMLRHPYRGSIIGMIEGRIPGMLQSPTRADVQALFDKIKNTATLTELTKLKQATETGGSPLGSNPTDRDAKIVETAASALIQTGDEREFEKELMRLRDKLYRLRTTAAASYNDTFREILPNDPSMKLRVPDIPKTYGEALKRAPKRVVRTGVHKGRRVVEYSDGSVDYAD